MNCVYCKEPITEANRARYKSWGSWLFKATICRNCVEAYKARIREFEAKEHSAQEEQVKALLLKARPRDRKMVAKLCRPRLRNLGKTDAEIDELYKGLGVVK